MENFFCISFLHQNEWGILSGFQRFQRICSCFNIIYSKSWHKCRLSQFVYERKTLFGYHFWRVNITKKALCLYNKYERRCRSKYPEFVFIDLWPHKLTTRKQCTGSCQNQSSSFSPKLSSSRNIKLCLNSYWIQVFQTALYHFP